MSRSKQMLPEEIWTDWTLHPVTRILLDQVLHRRRDELRNRWERGDFTDQSQFGTAIANAAAIGQIEAIRWMQELTYETFKGALEDEEPERSETSG